MLLNSLRRRWLLRSGIAVSLGGVGLSNAAQALTRTHLQFPRDAGAHLDFQTEWWYVTGYANTPDKEAALGFQLTFFRTRVPAAQELQSSLAAKHLIFAHAAVTDVLGKKLWHDQRIARWSGEPQGRNSADMVSASTQETAVRLGNWSLLNAGSSVLAAKVIGTHFEMDLRLTPTQPVLLQGEQGLSRKGPATTQASFYYSIPHLQVSGDIVVQGKRQQLSGGSTAWLDHEWSQSLLGSDAAGWDWIGINLFGGGALTAFQIRNKAKSNAKALWNGGSIRTQGKLINFLPNDVIFMPMRYWRSTKSNTSYPVEWTVRTPVETYTVKAVIDDQELDSSASTGTIYWEGLCNVWDSQNRPVGRGYLEMTGYAAPLKM